MPTTPVRPVAVSKPEAAALLSVSVDLFEQRVQPELPVLRCGRRQLYRLADLEQWAEANVTTPARG